MAVRLLFLGRLQDAAGGAEREIDGAASLSDVMRNIEPALAASLAEPRIKLALNGTIVADRESLVLADGDELAFLPPVSGG